MAPDNNITTGLAEHVAQIAEAVKRIPELAHDLRSATTQIASAERSWTQGRAADSQAMADLRADLRILARDYQRIEKGHLDLEKIMMTEISALRTVVEANSDLRKEALWTRRLLTGGVWLLATALGIISFFLSHFRAGV